MNRWKLAGLSFLVGASTNLFLFLVTVRISSSLCCDQYTHAGLPFSFYQSGGFTGHTTFSSGMFLLDTIIWIALAGVLLYFLIKHVNLDKLTHKKQIVLFGLLSFLLAFLVYKAWWYQPLSLFDDNVNTPTPTPWDQGNLPTPTDALSRTMEADEDTTSYPVTSSATSPDGTKVLMLQHNGQDGDANVRYITVEDNIGTDNSVIYSDNGPLAEFAEVSAANWSSDSRYAFVKVNLLHGADIVAFDTTGVSSFEHPEVLRANASGYVAQPILAPHWISNTEIEFESTSISNEEHEAWVFDMVNKTAEPKNGQF